MASVKPIKSIFQFARISPHTDFKFPSNPCEAGTPCNGYASTPWIDVVILPDLKKGLIGSVEPVIPKLKPFQNLRSASFFWVARRHFESNSAAPLLRQTLSKYSAQYIFQCKAKTIVYIQKLKKFVEISKNILWTCPWIHFEQAEM